VFKGREYATNGQKKVILVIEVILVYLHKKRRGKKA
jgi:hypothetical protein